MAVPTDIKMTRGVIKEKGTSKQTRKTMDLINTSGEICNIQVKVNV